MTAKIIPLKRRPQGVDMDPDVERVVDRIHELFLASGYGMAYVCYKSGVTRRTITKWFNKETRKPQAPTLNIVLRVFGKRLMVGDL